MSVASSLTDPGAHAFWIASRALGIVAVLLVSLAVGIGLALAARADARPGGGARLKTLHEALSLCACGAIIGHGLTLLGDSYLAPGLAGITIPFVIGVSRLWTALGILGAWLTMVITASFYVRRWIGNDAWRRLHKWTGLAYVLALIHTVGSGTDSGSAWLIVALALATAPVAYAAALRFLPDEPRVA